MTEYIGIALIGASVIGLIWRSMYLGRQAKYQRLRNALQDWVDAIVELYEHDDDNTA